MVIRSLKRGDFEQGFQETLENLRPIGDVPIEKLVSILHEIDRNPNQFVFVAIADGNLIGSITLLIEQKFIRQGGLVGHIEDVVTRKGHEGKGVGKALITTAVAKAKRCGCYKVILDCTEENVSFYEKLGFKRHEIEMRLDL
jgi:glucosamine-phosphate N-acetyltransferase